MLVGMDEKIDIEDEISATPLLAEPEKPNRTLLHYFKAQNAPRSSNGEAQKPDRGLKAKRTLIRDEEEAKSPDKKKNKRGKTKKMAGKVEQREEVCEVEEEVVLEVVPKVKNPISGFFKKVTRDEYCKELEKSASKIVIQAEIHSPLPIVSPKIHVKGKSRLQSTTRLSLETDQVNLIEVVEEHVEEVEQDDMPCKISSTLFKKRKALRQDSESAKLPLEDVSVDVDFFAKGQPSPISADLNGPVIEMQERKRPSSKMDEVQISPVEKASKPDGDDASSIIQHLDDDDVGSKECFDSKILGLKGKKVNISPVSPQLFKKRPKRRRRVAGTNAARKHPVNYDSDSLDVDILSKLNPKEFHAGQTTSSMEIDFDNSSSNAFSVLMKQPLSTEAVGANTMDDDENDVEELVGNGQTFQDRIDDGTSSRSSGGMSSCQLADRPPNSKHTSPSSDKENKTNRPNSVPMSTSAPPPMTTTKTGPCSVVQNAFTRLMTTKIPISSSSISPPAQATKSSLSSSSCKKAMKTIGLVGEEKEEDQIKVGSDIGTSEVVRKKRGLKRKKKPTIKKSDVLDIEVEEVEREIVEINEEPHFPPGEDAFSAHKTEKKDTLKDPEDESHLSGSSQRRSSRISRNRDTFEKRRQEQEDMERLIDDEISSPRKRRSRKIDHKRAITVQGNDFSNDGPLSNGEDDDEVRIEKIVLSPVKKQKKTGSNLAPIFIKGQKANSIRVIEDPEKVAARRAFLMSSAPEVIRTQQQKSMDETTHSDLDSSLPFPSVSHVRQCDGKDTFWNLEMPKASADLLMAAARLKDPADLSLRTSNNNGDEGMLGMGQFATLISEIGTTRNQEKEKQTNDHPEASGQRRMNSWQIYHFVKSLKMANDAFPMRKIFRRYVERKIEADTLEAEVRQKNLSLNDIVEERSKGRRRLRKTARNSHCQRGNEDKSLSEVKFDAALPSSMQWTMKYTPQMTDDMIGNLGVVRKLQTWLEGWKTSRPRHSVGKRSEKRKKLDSSFVVEDSSEGDEEGDSISSDDLTGSGSDGETGTNLCNTALLTGPTGVGKTSCVYALARQMGFKVLEVNASSIRGGRQVVAQLQEATQSHHLTKQQQQQKQKEQAKHLVSSKGKSKSKKNKSHQDSSNDAESTAHLKRTALILFEDIDVVFDDLDDGFYGAVNNLISTTKRPIILTTSNPHFMPKKLFKSASVLDSLQTFEFKPVAPRLIANYLQLMALAEGVAIDIESITSLVALNGCLISKSVLDLQYWATSKNCGPLISCIEGDIPPEICKDKLHEENVFSSEDGLAKLMSINKHLISNSVKTKISGQKTSHSSSSSSAGVPGNDVFATVRPFSGCDLALMGLRDEQNVSLTQTKNRTQVFQNNVEHLRLWGYGDIYEQNCHLLLGLPTEPPSSSGQKKIYPLTSDGSALEEDGAHRGSSKRYRRIQNFADLDNSIFACDSDEDEPLNEASSLEETNKSSFKDANIADKEHHEARPRNDGDGKKSSCVGEAKRRPNGTNETEERGEQECPLSRVEKVKAPKTMSEKMAFQNAHQAMIALSNCAEANSHFSTLEDRPPWWVLDNSLADQMVRSSEKLLARDDAPYSQASVSAAIEASVQQMTLTLARKRVQDALKRVQGDEINVIERSHPFMRRSLETESTLSLINDHDHHYPISSSSSSKTTAALVDRFHSRETLNAFLSELTICPRPHLTDTLPIIRGMARLEEIRRSGGGAKKSRSGRFLHYFDAQELYLKPSTLSHLCNSFL